MSTDIFRKYIDIINEAQDFSSQAKALRQRRIDTIREWVYQEIEEIYKGAATKGWDMTDNIADELGDHFAQVQRSGDPVLQRAYEMVRELSDSTPEEQAAGALKAMKMLKGQVDKESELAALAKQHGMEHRQDTYGAELKHPTNGSVNVDRYGEWNHYPAGSKNSAAHGGYKELANYLKKMSGN